MIRTKPILVPAAALILLCATILAACRGKLDFFAPDGQMPQGDLADLFSLIEKYADPADSKERFILNRQIIDFYSNTEAEQKKILYLNYIVEKYPNDPFNAYYTAVVAQACRKRGDSPFALYYYGKAVSLYGDLFYSGEYIHKYCLEELASLSADPEEKIVYYRELLDKFGASVNRGEILYFLARSYEKVGDYAMAIETYRAFLQAPPVIIAGAPDAAAEVKEKLGRYERRPEWVVRDLNGLVARIREAIMENDPEKLMRYRAGDSFFTLTWEQVKDQPPVAEPTDVSVADYIGAFLLNSKVHVSETLDIFSSAREAYLRTENWAFQIHSTWYFYFKKVEFGPDPDINGGWEWAGVYFGEKL